MRKRFVRGMVIYAIVFLAITAAGLAVLWNFIDAYEQSRPMNTVKAYVSGITDADLCAGAEELLAQLDSNIQSREEACTVITDSVEGELSYAKKSGESSNDRQVYVLRNGRQVIGQFVITAGEPDKYGFRVWSVTESSFDFAHLMGENISVTIPSDFAVSINGKTLSEAYITEENIPFAALEEFYGDYTLPTMVTYTADSFLGSLAVEVTDRDGKLVELTEDTDMNDLLPACSQSITEFLESFTNSFLYSYVKFTSSANDSAGANYNQLKKYLVPDSELAKRLYTAIDGLQFAQSWSDTIQQITVNRLADVGNDRYLCDLTYEVETWGQKGAVETVNNVKLIVVETGDGLKVEAMTRY